MRIYEEDKIPQTKIALLIFNLKAVVTIFIEHRQQHVASVRITPQVPPMRQLEGSHFAQARSSSLDQLMLDWGRGGFEARARGTAEVVLPVSQWKGMLLRCF